MNRKSFTHLPALAVILFVPLAAQATQWDKKTILTINEEIQVKDRVLEPGQYVFKLLDSNSERHVVQIYNRDETHIIDTVLAIPDYRLEPTGKTQFRFWETPTGYVKALRAWFYPGDNFGQEFTYPKNLTRIAMTTAVAAPAPLLAPLPEPQPEIVPPPAPEPVAQNAAPIEMAQNDAPPAPSAMPDAPSAMAPKSLPKTASPYPLVGLVGLLFVGGFAMLRFKKAL